MENPGLIAHWDAFKIQHYVNPEIYKGFSLFVMHIPDENAKFQWEILLWSLHIAEISDC